MSRRKDGDRAFDMHGPASLKRLLPKRAYWYDTCMVAEAQVCEQLAEIHYTATH